MDWSAIQLWKKRTDNVPETSLDRLNKAIKRIIEQDARIIALEMDMDNMRNKVLRKIQSKQEPEIEKSEVKGGFLVDSKALSSPKPFG